MNAILLRCLLFGTSIFMGSYSCNLSIDDCGVRRSLYFIGSILPVSEKFEVVAFPN